MPEPESENILRHLQEGATSDAAFAGVKSKLEAFPDFDQALPVLAAGIDNSTFPTGEWIDALAAFFEIIHQARIPSLQSMVGFIVCCAESQAKYPIRPPLSDVVRELLEEYGFEGV